MMYERVIKMNISDQELKAKCLLMLTMIDRENENYKKQIKQYKDTRVYELALTHCSDFNG